MSREAELRFSPLSPPESAASATGTAPTSSSSPSSGRPRLDIDVGDDADWCADCKIVLSRGTTAYKLLEPAVDAQVDHVPLVVCLHDMTNSSYMWKDIGTLLADARSGPPVRVLVLDFYGHGRSPYGAGLQCTLELYVNQVQELLTATGLLSDEIPFILLGQGMGASVALGFAAKYPNAVKSLCLLSPVGLQWETREAVFPHRQNPLQPHLLRLPIIGRWLWRRRMKKGLAEAFTEYVFCPNGPKTYATSGVTSGTGADTGTGTETYADSSSSFAGTDAATEPDTGCGRRQLIRLERAMVLWQIRHTPGYIQGLQSTLLHFPYGPGAMSAVCSALRQHPVRAICVLWGERDNVCGGPQGGRQSMQLGLEEGEDNCRFITVEGAGHFPLVENFAAAASAILAFMGESCRSLRADLVQY